MQKTDQFPDLETDLALDLYARNNNIKGFFFLDDEGKQFIWGKGALFNQYQLPL